MDTGRQEVTSSNYSFVNSCKNQDSRIFYVHIYLELTRVGTILGK